MERPSSGFGPQLMRRRTTNVSGLEGRVPLTKRGGYARSEEHISCDVDQILKGLTWHHSFPMEGGYEIKNLPKFNDLTAYDIPEEKESAAWKREVERLAREAACQEPLLFQDQADRWGVADRDGYTNVHKLALQLETALDICLLDNERLLMESAPQYSFTAYKKSLERLSMNFDLEHGELQYEESLRIGKDNTPCLHDLVDYITCVLLRVLQRSMKGDFWLHNCIRVLATIAAKVKTLGYNLTEAATTSLAEAAQSRTRLEKKGRGYLFSGSAPRKDEDGDTQQGDGPNEITRSVPGKRYYFIMASFNHCIMELFSTIVRGLSNGELPKYSIDGFQASALIYDDAGVHERLTHLYNQRDGTIGATADPVVLESASICFAVAFESWNALAKRYPETAGSVADAGPYTELYWKKTPTEADGSLLPPDSPQHSQRTIRVRKMHQVISLLAPYNLVGARGSAILHTLSRLVSFIAQPQNPVRPFPPERFLAVAKIRTSVYLTSRAKLETDPEVCTVADSVLAQRKCLADGPMAPLSMAPPSTITYDTFATDESLRRRRAESRRDIQETLQKLKSWLIDGRSIIIPLRWYCWTIIGACLALVLGGIAIGFSAGESIRGVDPSNITLFCWALSGFFAVLAKELRVKNWPWRDFLQGQVVCCSVTEVCSTSNVKPQTLLAVLLQLEYMMILSKRGPYHTAFTRKADDGFSVDVPIETMTFIDGGIIPIKVQSTHGPALVFLPVPPWGLGFSIESQGQTKDGQRLTCRSMREPWELPGDKMPRYTLCSDTLQWHTIEGVYKKDARFH